MPYQFLADAVLAAHIAIVVFVIMGLVLVIAGNLLRWQWVNRLWFRASRWIFPPTFRARKNRAVA